MGQQTMQSARGGEGTVDTPWSHYSPVPLDTRGVYTADLFSVWPITYDQFSRITAALNRNPSTRIQTYRKEAASSSLFCWHLSASLESYTDTKFLGVMFSHAHQASSQPVHLPSTHWHSRSVLSPVSLHPTIGLSTWWNSSSYRLKVLCHLLCELARHKSSKDTR